MRRHVIEQQLAHAYTVREQLAERINHLERALALALASEPRPFGGARHGTDSGYYAHRRSWKTPPCAACRRAHRDAQRVRDRRRRLEQQREADVTAGRGVVAS